jgi:acyl carrier protein
MSVQELINRYKKAIEQDKVLEGQYKVIENQLSKILMELGMSYEEALEREQTLKKVLSENLPKVQAYIQTIETKKKIAEEHFI